MQHLSILVSLLIGLFAPTNSATVDCSKLAEKAFSESYLYEPVIITLLEEACTAKTDWSTQDAEACGHLFQQISLQVSNDSSSASVPIVVDLVTKFTVGSTNAVRVAFLKGIQIPDWGSVNDIQQCPGSPATTTSTTRTTAKPVTIPPTDCEFTELDFPNGTTYPPAIILKLDSNCFYYFHPESIPDRDACTECSMAMMLGFTKNYMNKDWANMKQKMLGALAKFLDSENEMRFAAVRNVTFRDGNLLNMYYCDFPGEETTTGGTTIPFIEGNCATKYDLQKITDVVAPIEAAVSTGCHTFWDGNESEESICMAMASKITEIIADDALSEEEKFLEIIGAIDEYYYETTGRDAFLEQVVIEGWGTLEQYFNCLYA